jgi:hypothetical protein
MKTTVLSFMQSLAAHVARGSQALPQNFGHKQARLMFLGYRFSTL